jgi:hypothetical protein
MVPADRLLAFVAVALVVIGLGATRAVTGRED